MPQKKHCLICCCHLLLLTSPICGLIRYKLIEESRPGTLVGNILRDSGLLEKYNDKIINKMQLRFLAEPKLPFSLDENSGLLRTAGRLDRDQVCAYAVSCIVRVDIATFPVKNLEIIKVHVEITDTNDNYPTFLHQNRRMKYKLMESAEIGVTLALPAATDPDSPPFSIQRYELEPTSRHFGLEYTPTAQGITDVRLKVIEKLDREERDKYNLRIIAVDGGNPQKTGALDVRVVVEDANDNRPRFNATQYDVNLKENLPVHSVIIRVKALDPDAGDNGQVIYNFTARTHSNYGHLFGINERTGDIFSKAPIDFEKGPIYHLGIIARDRGPNSMSADATVVIRVMDENDHKPDIRLDTISASDTSHAEVPENSAVGIFVAQVTVKDLDSGSNGMFHCKINDKNFELKQRQKGSYQIVSRAVFDREERGSYNIQLLCEDEGQPTQISIKHIHIEVLDENDNSPYFKPSEYNVNILENNFDGAKIVELNATDKDSHENGNIRYFFEKEKTKELFHLNEETGVITARVILDREILPVIKFSVFAIDGGVPYRSASALVVIRIDDLNDEAPKFDQKEYFYEVFENDSPHLQLGQVAATDNDAPPANLFEFSFKPTFIATRNFEVHPQTGVITTRRSFDRERTDVYKLLLIATDKGTPPMSASASVTVRVLDRNDNPPKFIYPTPRNNSRHISHMTPQGHVIAHVYAQDRDIGRNGHLTYRFLSGNEKHLFKIDKKTGSVSVKAKLERFEYSFNELRIEVKDKGVPQKTAFSNLYVVVNSSIPYWDASTAYNSDIQKVIGVVGAASGIAAVLIIAIAIVCRKGNSQSKNNRYNCRKAEAVKMLNKNGEVIHATNASADEEYAMQQAPEQHPVIEAAPLKQIMTSQMQFSPPLHFDQQNVQQQQYYPIHTHEPDIPNGVILTGAGDVVNTQSMAELRREKSREILSKSRDTLAKSQEFLEDNFHHSISLLNNPLHNIQDTSLPPPAYHATKEPPEVPPKPSAKLVQARSPMHQHSCSTAHIQHASGSRSLDSALPPPPVQASLPSSGGTLQRQFAVTAKELEQHTLRKLKDGGENSLEESESSAEGSGTDSGHGPSEEGDALRQGSLSPMPPPSSKPSDSEFKSKTENDVVNIKKPIKQSSDSEIHGNEDKHKRIAQLQRQYTIELTSSLSIESVSGDEDTELCSRQDVVNVKESGN